MERKIGEVFEYQGKKLKVVETAKDLCFDCYFFDGVNCQRTEREGGECSNSKRADYKSVIFVEADKEQYQDEQPQELNLCEVLEHCPKGEQFWSPMFGYVVYNGIIKGEVGVTVASGVPMIINADGTLTINFVTSPEIMLYPSRTQRSWTDVKYEPKKERFDPKTLKPFDKILVRNDIKLKWNINMFSHISNDETYKYIGLMNTSWVYCIPYNDDTKYLIGTIEEVPEYYRYWEK